MPKSIWERPLYLLATHRQFKALAHSGTPEVSKSPSQTTVNDLEANKVPISDKKPEERDPYLIDEVSSPEISPKLWPVWYKVRHILCHIMYNKSNQLLK